MNNTIIPAGTLFDMALYYATARGWRVLPVRAGSKKPIIREWQIHATNNPEQIRNMFHNHNGNIGVACGAASGIVVIDAARPGHNKSTGSGVRCATGHTDPTHRQKRATSFF